MVSGGLVVLLVALGPLVVKVAQGLLVQATLVA
jgi:hypothetical protein